MSVLSQMEAEGVDPSQPEIHAGGELVPTGLATGAVGLDDLLRAAAC